MVPSAKPSQAGELQVKAAFLFNFALFVEWPAEPSDSLTFCVAGDRHMQAQLQTTLKGKKIRSRAVTVRPLTSSTEAASCNVVFIGREEKKRAAQVAQAVAGKGVLSVSELPELGRQGVVINFFLDEEKVRFEIHLQAAAKAGVKIRSELLKLSRIADD